MHKCEVSLARGLKAEQLLAPHLRRVFDPLYKATGQQEARGIDFIGIYKATGNPISLQIKSDERAATTGNAFIETWSVHPITPGWAVTCEADLIFYCLPQIPRVYCLRPNDIRQMLPTWEVYYQQRSIPNRHRVHGTYTTVGLLVPLVELAEVAVAIAQ